MRFTLKIFLILFLGSCSLSEMQEGLLDDEVKPFLENLNQALIDQDGSYLISKAHVSIVDENLAANFGQVLDYFPEGDLETVEIATVNYQTLKMISGYSSKTYNVSYHFDFGSEFALVSYSLIDEGEGYQIKGLFVNKSNVSFREINAFTKVPLSPLKILVLFWAISVVAFIIWIFVLAMKEKNLKRKPLWGIFILLGFGAFVLNWTTGAFAFQPLSFSLLGAGYSAAGHFSPIIFKVALPVGAVVFLIKKKTGKLKYKKQETKG